MMVGPSRKAFLAKGTVIETQFATAAAVTAAAIGGAHMVRVHDVAEMRAVLAVADEVVNATAALAAKIAAKAEAEPVAPGRFRHGGR